MLERDGIDAELVDVRSVMALYANTLLESVKKTGSLLIADGAWQTCGVAAEISATVAEKAYYGLKAPIKRTTLPSAPAPKSKASRCGVWYYFTVAADVSQFKNKIDGLQQLQ